MAVNAEEPGRQQRQQTEGGRVERRKGLFHVLNVEEPAALTVPDLLDFFYRR